MGRKLDKGLVRLTEKEKEVLRLLGKGYDVKSTAQSLKISTTTVTERLRSARTKLSVGSSREAARILAKAEEEDPIFSGDIFSEVDEKHIFAAKLDTPTTQAGVANLATNVEPVKAMSVLEGFSILSDLPLRKQGELRNSLTKRQRAFAIVDIALKLSIVVALITMLALVLNIFTDAR
jgi:DNA-binding CsgD family transcriptional regulator